MSEQANDKLLEDMFGVFNKEAKDINLGTQEEGSSDFFNPDSKNSPNQTFYGMVKFLPNLEGERQLITKIRYWVPEGDQGFMFDSPKSLGKYEDCPVANTFWALKGSKNVMEQEKAKKIVWKPSAYALVQIIMDKTTPANVGKVMLWKIPQAIEKKINAKMFPTKEDVEMGKEANNIFDPINGAPMALKIPIEKKGEAEYRNYDECNFVDRVLPMIIEGESKPATLPTDATELRAVQMKMLETIKAGPSLNGLAYEPATAETLTRVQNALAALTGTAVEAKAEAKPEAKAEAKPEAKPEATEPEAKAEATEPEAEQTADTSKSDAALMKELGLD